MEGETGLGTDLGDIFGDVETFDLGAGLDGYGLAGDEVGRGGGRPMKAAAAAGSQSREESEGGRGGGEAGKGEAGRSGGEGRSRHRHFFALRSKPMAKG